MTTLGQLLKHHRHARGITARDLAELSGLSATIVNRLEINGVNSLKRDSLLSICKALGLDSQQTDEFLVLAGKMPKDIEAAIKRNYKPIFSFVRNMGE